MLPRTSAVVVLLAFAAAACALPGGDPPRTRPTPRQPAAGGAPASGGADLQTVAAIRPADAATGSSHTGAPAATTGTPAVAPPAPIAPAPVAPPVSSAAPVASAAPAGPAARPRELPFDPSPEDRPHAGVTGFLGTRRVALADGTEALGPIVAGVKPGSGADAAGLREGDVIVSLAGRTFRPSEADPIGAFREALLRHAPDTTADVEVWRQGSGVRAARVLLGRQPPAFARIDTPAEWMRSEHANGAIDDLIRAALAADGGAPRFDDTLARNRKHSQQRDVFRVREVTQAHLDLSANEALAVDLATTILGAPAAAAQIADGSWRVRRPSAQGWTDAPAPNDVEAIVGEIARRIADIDAHMRRATAAWSAEEREFVAANLAKLTERLVQGEYLFDDEDVARERANRRVVAILAKTDRAEVAAAAELVTALAENAARALVPAVESAAKDGLVASRDTPAGRIEVWGRGHQRHSARCAFLFDLEGDDNYLDVAGRADLAQPVSVYVDASGDDLWAATAPFGLAGALGGAAVVLDLAGDDQYLARDWSEGAAVAGFALLADRAGRDVYHAQHLSQGIGLAGAGVVSDESGADLYTGARFCQGVGLPGGVGSLVDRRGDDRFVCTGRYDSEYGEAGLFSGWGQGVGFGFRNIASGGIGVLLDESGDDVYEAGNFSQGGGYFYGWGILWDAKGRDRYVGSRYAQGFAAHQAVGTFLEGAGDDLYQSHSGVAQGLAWDEASVVFHDMGGNDRYRTAGFSLASAAHNGMVLFLDDAGDDVYAATPARAASNTYHGGHSFALFVDRAGRDTYLGADEAAPINGRTVTRDEGAYLVDRP